MELAEAEKVFRLSQLRERAEYRCRGGRAMPIDMIILLADSKRPFAPSKELLLEASSSAMEAEMEELLALDTEPLCTMLYRAILEHRRKGDRGPSAEHFYVKEDVVRLIDSESRTSSLQDCLHKITAARSRAEQEYWMAVEPILRERLCLVRLTDLHTMLVRKKGSALQMVDFLGPCTAEEAPIEPSPFEELKRAHFAASKNLHVLHCLDDPASPAALPRYFASTTCIERWTRHNERHHDTFNPPPVVCEAFTICIEYPQLQRSPTFRILRDPECPEPTIRGEDPDTVILEVAAEGFEALRFKVPGWGWDRNERHGFRSVFEGSIMQLHVKMKRRVYSRR